MSNSIMSDEYKPTVHQQEAEIRPKKKGGAKRHCLRFWWAYLIAFIAIVIVAVCIM